MKKLLLLTCTLYLFIACEAIFIEDISNEEVTIISPTEGSEFDKAIIKFNWNKLDNADQYHFQIAKPNFNATTQIVEDTLVEVAVFSKELPTGDYQWRVNAINSEFETNYVTSSFKIKAKNISTERISITTPLEASEIDKGVIDFTWNELENADRYHIQIAKPDFSINSNIFEDTFVETNTFEKDLSEGDYECRIRAMNSDYETNYTTLRFTVK